MTERSFIPILAVTAALAIVPFVSGAIGLDYLLPIFTRMLVYGLAAVSLNLLVGYAGVFSFGHAAFVAIGAYGAAIGALHAQSGDAAGIWNEALVTWTLALAAAAVAALAVGLVCMRTDGITLVMVTLSLGQMFYLLLVSLKAYGGDDGLTMYPRNQLAGFSLDGDTTIYLTSLGALFLYLSVVHGVMRSRFGRIVAAVRINPTRTTALGFSTYWAKVICFVVAGVGAALAGLLLANANEFVSPTLANWTFTGELLTMVVIGGVGTRLGPLAGAIAYTGIVQVASLYFEQTGLVVGLVLVGLVLFSRGGLVGMIAERSRSWLIKFS